MKPTCSKKDTKTRASGMPRKTLKALKQSIAHWQRMIDDPDGEDQPNGSQCALCRIFLPQTERWDEDPNNCVGCPVMARTRLSLCRGTPYGAARKAYLSHNYVRDEKSRNYFISRARKELTFLKSLLPPTERTRKSVSKTAS
jgi:hypothetical protein